MGSALGLGDLAGDRGADPRPRWALVSTPHPVMAQAAGLRVTDAYVGYDPATTSPRPPDTSGAALSGRHPAPGLGPIHELRCYRQSAVGPCDAKAGAVFQLPAHRPHRSRWRPASAGAPRHVGEHVVDDCLVSSPARGEERHGDDVLLDTGACFIPPPQIGPVPVQRAGTPAATRFRYAAALLDDEW